MGPTRHSWPIWAVAVAVLAVAACGNDAAPSTGGAPSTTAAHAHDGGSTDATPTVRRDGDWFVVTTGYTEERTRWEPGTEPAAAEQAAQDELVAATRASLVGIEDLADAQAAGWDVEETQDGLSTTIHWMSPENLDDGVELDPTRPEALVVSMVTDQVLGAMFMTGADEPPQPGPDARWHRHILEVEGCLYDDGAALAAGAPMLAPTPCPDGTHQAEATELMVHVWLVDNPAGPFGIDMELPTSDVVPRLG